MEPVLLLLVATISLRSVALGEQICDTATTVGINEIRVGASGSIVGAVAVQDGWVWLSQDSDGRLNLWKVDSNLQLADVKRSPPTSEKLPERKWNCLALGKSANGYSMLWIDDGVFVITEFDIHGERLSDTSWKIEETGSIQHCHVGGHDDFISYQITSDAGVLTGWINTDSHATASVSLLVHTTIGKTPFENLWVEADASGFYYVGFIENTLLMGRFRRTDHGLDHSWQGHDRTSSPDFMVHVIGDDWVLVLRPDKISSSRPESKLVEVTFTLLSVRSGHVESHQDTIRRFGATKETTTAKIHSVFGVTEGDSFASISIVEVNGKFYSMYFASGQVPTHFPQNGRLTVACNDLGSGLRISDVTDYVKSIESHICLHHTSSRRKLAFDFLWSWTCTDNLRTSLSELWCDYDDGVFEVEVSETSLETTNLGFESQARTRFSTTRDTWSYKECSSAVPLVSPETFTAFSAESGDLQAVDVSVERNKILLFGEMGNDAFITSFTSDGSFLWTNIWRDAFPTNSTKSCASGYSYWLVVRIVDRDVVAQIRSNNGGYIAREFRFVEVVDDSVDWALSCMPAADVDHRVAALGRTATGESQLLVVEAHSHGSHVIDDWSIRYGVWSFANSYDFTYYGSHNDTTLRHVIAFGETQQGVETAIWSVQGQTSVIHRNSADEFYLWQDMNIDNSKVFTGLDPCCIPKSAFFVGQDVLLLAHCCLESPTPGSVIVIASPENVVHSPKWLTIENGIVQIVSCDAVCFSGNCILTLVGQVDSIDGDSDGIVVTMSKSESDFELLWAYRHRNSHPSTFEDISFVNGTILAVGWVENQASTRMAVVVRVSLDGRLTDLNRGLVNWVDESARFFATPVALALEAASESLLIELQHVGERAGNQTETRRSLLPSTVQGTPFSHFGLGVPADLNTCVVNAVKDIVGITKPKALGLTEYLCDALRSCDRPCLAGWNGLGSTYDSDGNMVLAPSVFSALVLPYHDSHGVSIESLVDIEGTMYYSPHYVEHNELGMFSEYRDQYYHGRVSHLEERKASQVTLGAGISPKAFKKGKATTRPTLAEGSASLGDVYETVRLNGTATSIFTDEARYEVYSLDLCPKALSCNWKDVLSLDIVNQIQRMEVNLTDPALLSVIDNVDLLRQTAIWEFYNSKGAFVRTLQVMGVTYARSVHTCQAYLQNLELTEQEFQLGLSATYDIFSADVGFNKVDSIAKMAKCIEKSSHEVEKIHGGDFDPTADSHLTWMRSVMSSKTGPQTIYFGMTPMYEIVASVAPSLAIAARQVWENHFHIPHMNPPALSSTCEAISEEMCPLPSTGTPSATPSYTWVIWVVLAISCGGLTTLAVAKKWYRLLVCPAQCQCLSTNIIKA